MFGVAHVLPVRVRRLLGRLEYVAFALAGWAGERWQLPYEIDARWCTARRMRDYERHRSADLSDGRMLTIHESSRFSQNGEDGVIEEVFRRIGTHNRIAIEIGASDGAENCTRDLVEKGWTAIWVEADPAKAGLAEAVSERVTVVAEEARRDSVVDQLHRSGAPMDPDLLSIDVDGDDNGLLEACLGHLRPRVVAVEYNSAFSPSAVWDSKGRFRGGWDGTFRHGASLGALDLTARRAGYVLVHCESTGVNAFFVRGDLEQSRFAEPGDLEVLHRVPSFSVNPSGHPRSQRACAPMTPLSRAELRDVGVHAAAFKAAGVAPGAPVPLELMIHNDSDRWLTSSQDRWAFNLASSWDDRDGSRERTRRIPLPRPVAPRSRSRLKLVIAAPDHPGRHRLRITAVAESVAWRDELGGTGAVGEAELMVTAPQELPTAPPQPRR